MADGRGEFTPSIRVLLVADERSPITWGWVDAVRSAGVTVLGADGRPWPEQRGGTSGSGAPPGGVRRMLRSFVQARPSRFKAATRLRRLLGPALAEVQGRRLRRTVDTVKPDLVHALRIPYEAMVAVAGTPRDMPLAVSIWGNDLTLHAPANRIVGAATRRVLARTDLLTADCQRDLDLALSWGLRAGTPAAVFPSGGGIDCADLLAAGEPRSPVTVAGAGETHRLVVNPRGVREYVRNDLLLEAMECLSSDVDPAVRFVFVDASHDEALNEAIASHPLADRCIVTGKLTRTEVLALLGRAEIMVSITDHDGTPNSLLEAMAVGAVPVCGDLQSIREWIEPGRNGFLAALDDPSAVADALRLALRLSSAERWAIGAENSRIIETRAERRFTGEQAAQKYRLLVNSS